MTKEQFETLNQRVINNARYMITEYVCIGEYHSGIFLSSILEIPYHRLNKIIGGDMVNNQMGCCYNTRYYIPQCYWEELRKEFTPKSITEQIQELDDEIAQKCTIQLNLEKEVEGLRDKVSALLYQQKKEQRQKMIDNLDIGQRFHHHEYQTNYILSSAGPGTYVLVNLTTGCRYTNPTTSMDKAFGSDISNFELIVK